MEKVLKMVQKKEPVKTMKEKKCDKWGKKDENFF